MRKRDDTVLQNKNHEGCEPPVGEPEFIEEIALAHRRLTTHLRYQPLI